MVPPGARTLTYVSELQSTMVSSKSKTTSSVDVWVVEDPEVEDSASIVILG